MDLWWNPQVESQAIDRVYRLGQKLNVHVHRVVVQGTIEDRILELQQQKLELANGVLDGGVGSRGAGGLSKRELISFFKD